jgi:hypothetical protein
VILQLRSNTASIRRSTHSMFYPVGRIDSERENTILDVCWCILESVSGERIQNPDPLQFFPADICCHVSSTDYDAVTTSPMRDAPREFQTTVFPVSDPTILPAAQELVKILKDRRYYTDTAGFDLRCQVG